MLRGLSTRWFVRSISIPTSSSRVGTFRRRLRSKNEVSEAKLKDEAELLDSQLKELKQHQQVLREKLALAKDRDLQDEVARTEGAEVNKPATAEELASLEASLQQGHSESPKLQLFENSSRAKSPIEKLPASIKNILLRRETKGVQLFRNEKTWADIVGSLPVLDKSIPQADIERLVSSIPVKQRAGLVARLNETVPDELRSQFVRDSFMAAYAELGQPEAIDKLISQSKNPTEYSFGHLAKAYFKTRARSEVVLDTIQRAKQANVLPSLPLYSTAVQSLIQHKQYDQAEALFDNMKYMATNTLPDLKLYNSMILAAAKQHNVNKALDLLEEMRTRRPHPLEPNGETYNTLVYACARDPERQLMAWDLFMEARNYGFEVNRESFRALLYLSGSTGEVLLARVLIRRLNEQSPAYVDDFALNCLYMAYSRWRPGPSTILGSHTGHSIRAQLLMDKPSFDGAANIPLLPVSQLNATLVLAESRAVIEYFADTSPDKLVVGNRASTSRYAHSSVVFNHLRTAMNLSDSIEEFRKGFNRFTKSATDSRIEVDNLDVHPRFSISRDQDLYRLAIQAAIKFKDLNFGREIWTERGQWRKTDAFRGVSQSERNQLDFKFARDLVELLAVSGRVDEAILLMKSAADLGRWRRHHVGEVLRMADELEDTQSTTEIMKLVHRS